MPLTFFPKWNRNSTNSGNLTNHWSMNRSQFKNTLCHLCVHGAVVSSLSLMQEVVGSRLRTLFLKISYKFRRFYRIHLEKARIIFISEFCRHIFFIHAAIKFPDCERHYNYKDRGDIRICGVLSLEYRFSCLGWFPRFHLELGLFNSGKVTTENNKNKGLPEFTFSSKSLHY